VGDNLEEGAVADGAEVEDVVVVEDSRADGSGGD
jgi:hypothetical protein